MVLANYTKWVSSQVFECGKDKLGPLGRGHLHHLMFISTLLLVWPVGHMYSHVADWITKCGQVPREFELTTYQSEFDT